MPIQPEQVGHQDGTAIRPGDRLDHYRIEEVVSQGRLATTFRATDLLTNRPVAIEIPRPEVQADPALAERLDREAAIEKTLDYPGLIRLIEKHGSEPGKTQSYLVREWFEGISLRELLSKGPLAPARAVAIVISICAIAEDVHSHAIILRDFEPEHILVGANDEVKLIHIGVSSKMGARRLTFTKLSQLVGASRFTSPEELKGRHADVRSDIYSIGAMLYEMVTGAQPFPGGRIEDRLSSYLVPPREIDPDISPQLQEVIYRAMEREPQNRYQSVHDFVWDLQHLDQVRIVERPELRDWKKDKSSRSRKALLYVVLALIPIVILGLLLYFARR